MKAKNLVFSILAMCFLTFIACEKDEFEDIERLEDLIEDSVIVITDTIGIITDSLIIDSIVVTIIDTFPDTKYDYSNFTGTQPMLTPSEMELLENREFYTSVYVEDDNENYVIKLMFGKTSIDVTAYKMINQFGNVLSEDTDTTWHSAELATVWHYIDLDINVTTPYKTSTINYNITNPTDTAIIEFDTDSYLDVISYAHNMHFKADLKIGDLTLNNAVFLSKFMVMGIFTTTYESNTFFSECLGLTLINDVTTTRFTLPDEFIYQ